MKIRSLTAALAGLALFASAAAAKSKQDADLAELQNYRLNAPVLKKLSQVQESIAAAIKADPGLAIRYQKSTSMGNESLDDIARRADGIPEFKQAVVKAGLTSREFFVATFALAEAAFASMTADGRKADGGKLPAAVRANIAFMKEHQAELAKIEKRTREIEEETKKIARAKEQSEQAEPAEDEPHDDVPDKK